MVMDEATAPLTEEELRALPVFPLPRLVFFPGSVLPLHFFEPRYREMIEDCVTTGPAAMAVTLLEPGWEPDYEGRPPIHTVAGAGRFLQHQRRPDGRFDVLLAGIARVQLEELPAEGKSYRRARATVLPDRAPHPGAVDRVLSDVLGTVSAVSGLVRQRHPEFDLGLDPRFSPGVIADRIADRMVADVERRQALLEQPDVKVRLALLNETLLELLASLAPSSGALH
jgi:Lon protease-like protein